MTPEAPRSPASLPVCGIGASAGGIEALLQFFDALPDDLGLAYAVIVHLAPDRKSDLAGILAGRTTMPVVQVGAHEQVALRPDHVYVIAPDRKLEITETSIAAATFSQPRGRRSAVDEFFRSLAARGDGFAVILSGGGSDGAIGARAVKESGGVVLVQDPDEAAHGGMPTAVIETGVADLVLPIAELVTHLTALVRRRKQVLPHVLGLGHRDAMPPEEEEALRAVLDLLRKRTGHDFTRYKRSTVARRLGRRIQLAHRDSIADYLNQVRDDDGELRALFDDFLISVTGFFRDPEAWEALRELVIAPLVDQLDAEPIRCWVPGCATGEEAYTLAMLFTEEFARRQVHPDVIIFASDVDEQALGIAREGVYPGAISADVTSERLERFFRAEGDHYRVTPRLRDHVVFAAHSVLRDPPFSRQHLVSCRNLLIYLERDLQDQAMAVFRYACRPDGHLFLGEAEHATADFFRPIDKQHRIFAVHPVADGARPPLPQILATPGRQVGVSSRGRPPERTSAVDDHLAAIELSAPPSVLVNDRYAVVHLSSAASRFLLQGAGPLAQRLTDLVRPELRDELHAALHRAFEGGQPQLSDFVRVTFDDTPHRVAVLAQRRPPRDGHPPQALVSFLDAGRSVAEPDAEATEPSDTLIGELREKLRQAERRVEAVRDDYYLTNEELRAANEELQSLNEEYRSTTEELETSREELQSTNEELQTMNVEMKIKLEEVSRAHADLENLMDATDVGTLFLDDELRITRFTPRLESLFRIRHRDVGRPIADLTHLLEYGALENDAAAVLREGQSIEREMQSTDGRSFVVRFNPYRRLGAASGEVSGVVIAFLDMTEMQRTRLALRESEQRLAVELGLMQQLHQAAMMIITIPTLSGALGALLSTGLRLVNARRGCIHLRDEASGRVRLAASHGLSGSFAAWLDRLPASAELAPLRALRDRATIAIDDVSLDEGARDREYLTDPDHYRAVLAVPLVAKEGDVVGVLTVMHDDPHQFSDRDRHLTGLLARQAADLVVTRTQQEQMADFAAKLRRHTDELEANQRRLSQQADELRLQDQNKERFLAALGHELRNPMSAIANGLELLAARGTGAADTLAMVRRQVVHLNRLVNDLLDTTRINRGLLRLQPDAVRLDEAIRTCADAMDARASSKGLSIRLQVPRRPVHVMADPERLAQMLDNLLDNAIKYTETGTITIGMQANAGQVQVSIRDTGIGVDPAEIPALFEPFRSAGGRHPAAGLGLGLSLVKQLVEMQGGELTFHSAGRGTGSEVILALPAATVAGSAEETVTGIPQLASHRVLVVDDHEDAADSLGGLLEAMGQDVRVAYDGAEALRVAGQFRPEVAFIDLSMPGMPGAEVGRRLRALFPEPALRLVAISGLPVGHELVRQGGFEDQLLKPAPIERLTELLARVDGAGGEG